MTGSLIRPEDSAGPLQPAPPPGGLARASDEDQGTSPQQLLQRFGSAVLRFKWLALALVVAGSAAGFAASRSLGAAYEVQGTIWISQETPDRRASGPIRAGGLVPTTSWPDLLRSYAVLDGVTRELRLYVTPENRRDGSLLMTLDVGADLRTGQYRLRIAPDSGTYALAVLQDRKEQVVERGALGDSIGRSIGVLWQPDAEQLRQRRQIAFSLTTPRAASVALRQRLEPSLPREGNLLRITLSGSDPWRTARTLNAVMGDFVATATELKRRNLTEITRTLEEQLEYAGRGLRDAEIQLENFRVQTITLPTEGTVLNGGIEATRDPVLTNFFDQKLAHEGVAHDRAALERTLADVRRGALNVDAFWPVLPTDDSARDLRQALTEYSNKEAELRNALQTYTEEHRSIRDQRAALARLRGEIIPGYAQTLVSQLRQRERDLARRIDDASRNLQSIPARTIEEVRLRRNVEVRAALYTSLRNRFEEARLAETSSIPDVAVLDTAIMPEQPVANRGRQLLLLAVVGSIGLAILLAIALDQLDRKVRYPEQVTKDLRLGLLGGIPVIKTSRRHRANPMDVAQLVEAFRSLRVQLAYSVQPRRPIALTVTSAGPGEGKSLVSANLALSFAEAGYRTVLVDADVRRGTLHSTFGVERRPGLMDVLRGSLPLAEALRPTSHARLTLLPCGARLRRSPEMLASVEFRHLMDTLCAEYDVVLVDSSPLAAGMDPLALSAATGNVLFVVRLGATKRSAAKAKLELLSRFPVHIVGAVLNAVPTAGLLGYDYGYSYLPGYETLDDEVVEEEGGGGRRAGTLIGQA